MHGMRILKNNLPFKRPYIYSILIVCNNILFPILTIFDFNSNTIKTKITYHLLLIGFSHQLVSMRGVEHNYVAFKCNVAAAITLTSCNNELSPTNDKDV